MALSPKRRMVSIVRRALMGELTTKTAPTPSRGVSVNRLFSSASSPPSTHPHPPLSSRNSAMPPPKKRGVRPLREPGVFLSREGDGMILIAAKRIGTPLFHCIALDWDRLCCDCSSSAYIHSSGRALALDWREDST